MAVGIDDTGSVEGIDAFIYCTKWGSGEVSWILRTDSLTTLKNRATQLLIKYKSGALVTQFLIDIQKSCAVYVNNILSSFFYSAKQ